MAATRPVRRELPESLALLARRTRPTTLAREDLLPVLGPLEELLGGPGLQRGATVVVSGTGVPGATSLLLALLAGPSTAGAWCAVVGAPDLGLAAAGELGVALGRLVLVPGPGRRLAQVAGALLEGCDVVCVCTPSVLAPPEARRLAARARERRAVLVVATGRAAGSAGSIVSSAPCARAGARPVDTSRTGWPGMPDVRLDVTASRLSGPGQGDGRVIAHLVEVAATRRRAAPEELRRWLWLPAADGRISLAPDGAAVPPAEPVGEVHRSASGAR
ncbi:MAG TPA: hypothetical protein VND23_10325 [Acidimicrobiales bacterium]|nr:hypothetical protein [Acidimicrobiales bacterium]